MSTESLDMNLRVVLSKLIRAVLVVLGVLVALPLAGIDITVLSVFGGALGVGLGFGLQKIASNYVSGFIILLDRSIHPGDVLTVDGRVGKVARLTARYLVLQGNDGTDAIIPNEDPDHLDGDQPLLFQPPDAHRHPAAGQLPERSGTRDGDHEAGGQQPTQGAGRTGSEGLSQIVRR